MKFLFLLGSVFSDWFTLQKKFAVCIIITFTMASFVMSFATALIGGLILMSEEDFQSQKGSYTIKYADDEEIGYAELNIVNSYIENVCNTAEEDFNHGELRVYGFFSDANEEYIDAHILPCYGDVEKYRKYLESSMFITAGVLNSYFNIYDNYAVSEGRRISEDDCRNSAYVLVLPGSFGLKIGDSVKFCGHMFEIVGLTDSDYTEIPAAAIQSVISSYALENPEYYIYCSYTANMDFKQPLTYKQCKAIENGIYEDTGVKITLVEGKINDGGTTGSFVVIEFVFGGIIGLFSMLCIYNVAVRLCESIMPMINLLKLCGMKRGKASLLLVCALFICLSVCFGMACAAAILSKSFFASFISNYAIRDFALIISAAVMAISACVAVLPPIFSIADKKVETNIGG